MGLRREAGHRHRRRNRGVVAMLLQSREDVSVLHVSHAVRENRSAMGIRQVAPHARVSMGLVSAGELSEK